MTARGNLGGEKSCEFEDEFVEGLRDIFERKIVFNEFLRFAVTSVRYDRVTARMFHRPEFVGHFSYNRLHGGVICAGLDNMGGLAVMAAIGARHMGEPPERRLSRFLKLGTIDIRIDFLRQATGSHFDLMGEVVRLGSRLATSRMECRSAGGELVATGCASFVVS